MPSITSFLTFNDQAEEAVDFYLSIFESGRIVKTIRMPDNGPAPKGSVLSVTFELLGQTFIALNGGPSFTFTPAFSHFVSCDTQAEIDDYWSKLTASGGREIQCGWLVDKYGVSWQIVPKRLQSMLGDKDATKSGRAMAAMMKMTKLDISSLERAYAGG